MYTYTRVYLAFFWDLYLYIGFTPVGFTPTVVGAGRGGRGGPRQTADNHGQKVEEAVARAVVVPAAVAGVVCCTPG